MSDTTIHFYNENASSYFDSTVNADMSKPQKTFLSYLPKGALILDAGCGSGRDSKAFKEQGYFVTPIDASEELCKLASNYLHQTVVCMTFQQLETENTFQGIWACASLLHISKEELPDVLFRFHRALRNKGILYATVKTGTGSAIENDRYFQYYQPEEFQQIVQNAGFTILDSYLSQDVRSNNTTTWINLFAQKN